jgi:hypothetical protein
MQLLTVSTVQLCYTVKEKGAKPDRKPFPLPYGLRNPYRNLKSVNSQHFAWKTSTKFINRIKTVKLTLWYGIVSTPWLNP